MENYNIDEVQRAIDLAESHHSGQFIKDSNIPYIMHCIKVMAETMNSTMRNRELDMRLAVLCAILHDTLEDTDLPEERIRKDFGEDVLTGVMALTKDESLPKEEQLMDSVDRITRCRKEIWVVKMCDRIINLAPPPASWTKEKIGKYINASLEIHRRLSPADDYTAMRLLDKIEEYKGYLV